MNLGALPQRWGAAHGDMMKKGPVGQSRHRTSDGGAGEDDLVAREEPSLTVVSVEIIS